MSQRQIEEIAHETHFNLHHHKKGTTIIDAGVVCDSLVIVTEGWIEIDTFADNNSYHLTEIVQAPQNIEPDKLFGLSPCYHSTYRAYTSCESITIPKESLNTIYTQSVIARLNLMNAICRRAQQLERQPWKIAPDDLKERIARFIKNHSHYPAGKKTLYIKMKQLAMELNASRLDVSIALNIMAEEEKIILKRGIIEVPALQLL